MPHSGDEKRAGQTSCLQSTLKQFSFIAVPLPAVMCDFLFLYSCLSIIKWILLFVMALSDANQDLINNTNNMILILIIFY